MRKLSVFLLYFVVAVFSCCCCFANADNSRSALWRDAPHTHALTHARARTHTHTHTHTRARARARPYIKKIRSILSFCGGFHAQSSMAAIDQEAYFRVMLHETRRWLWSVVAMNASCCCCFGPTPFAVGRELSDALHREVGTAATKLQPLLW